MNWNLKKDHLSWRQLLDRGDCFLSFPCRDKKGKKSAVACLSGQVFSQLAYASAISPPTAWMKIAKMFSVICFLFEGMQDKWHIARPCSQVASYSSAPLQDLIKVKSNFLTQIFLVLLTFGQDESNQQLTSWPKQFKNNRIFKYR